jgi:hypothetical protein
MNLVRVKRGRQAFIPAQLICVKGKSATIKPKGHRRIEVVPLDAIKPWKSRVAKQRDRSA